MKITHIFHSGFLAELEKTRVPAELAERHNRLVNAAKKPDWDALKKIFEE
jgi:preprotein translocase subunit Sss1